jgi:hypothetical protein
MSVFASTAARPLRARVRNGRLVLDEPTDLPEGEVVELVPLPLEDAVAPDDAFDDEERARLRQALDESIEQMKAIVVTLWGAPRRRESKP